LCPPCMSQNRRRKLNAIDFRSPCGI
jgi:hypothetical protein